MSDEAGLLDAIVHEPDDDLPRLAYADWLEENGRSGRAEFIRVQIELARGVADADRRKKLQKRERSLLLSNVRGWSKPFKARLSGIQYRRGFIEAAAASAPDFLADPWGLLHAAPIRGLALEGAAACPDELARCEALSWLEGLSLPGAWTALEPILASPHLARLKALGLERNALGANGRSLVALLDERFPSLERLSLASNDLDPEMLGWIGDGLLGRLCHLVLDDNQMRIDPILDRLSGRASRLKRFSAIRNGIREEELSWLVGVLPALKRMSFDTRVGLARDRLSAAHPHVEFVRASEPESVL